MMDHGLDLKLPLDAVRAFTRACDAVAAAGEALTAAAGALPWLAWGLFALAGALVFVAWRK